MFPTKFRSYPIPAGLNVAFDNQLLRDFISPSAFQSWNSAPAANIKENKENFTVELAAPGRSKDDFKLQVENKNLVISSEKVETQNTEEEKFSRREFKLSSFTRTFVLPETIDKENISAAYTNGILHITLPKKAEAVVDNKREISVK